VRPSRFVLPAIGMLGAALVACSGGAAATPAGSPASGAPGSVAVTASEMQFDPSALTVKAGQVTFSVTNGGTIEHEFEIFKGEAVVDEVEGLVPGVTLPLTVTLQAGDYTYVCKLAGHEEAGMKGTLTVTP
jgi:iron uptake system component EfeO